MKDRATTEVVASGSDDEHGSASVSSQAEDKGDGTDDDDEDADEDDEESEHSAGGSSASQAAASSELDDDADVLLATGPVVPSPVGNKSTQSQAAKRKLSKDSSTATQPVAKKEKGDEEGVAAEHAPSVPHKRKSSKKGPRIRHGADEGRHVRMLKLPSRGLLIH